MAESELFERGLQARRDVLGAEYVDANLADSDEFMMAFQRVVTEWAWGYAWSRPGLDRKTRSMLNLAILTALGRPDELGIYVKGALATGVSVEQRRDVLGAEYVDANLADTDEFMMAFQRVLTEWTWGYAWSRPGLDRKTRSMLNLAILTALGRPDELGIYVKGALATGVSVDEIKEILIHATVYCGTPAGRQAFRAAHEALMAEGVLRRPS